MIQAPMITHGLSKSTSQWSWLRFENFWQPFPHIKTWFPADFKAMCPTHCPLPPNSHPLILALCQAILTQQGILCVEIQWNHVILSTDPNTKRLALLHNSKLRLGHNETLQMWAIRTVSLRPVVSMMNKGTNEWYVDQSRENWGCTFVWNFWYLIYIYIYIYQHPPLGVHLPSFREVVHLPSLDFLCYVQHVFLLMWYDWDTSVHIWYILYVNHKIHPFISARRRELQTNCHRPLQPCGSDCSGDGIIHSMHRV